MELEIKKLSFHYEAGFQLHEINLQIPTGAFLGIIGPNGSGKSTLLKLLAKALVPDQGQILIDQKNIQDLSQRAFARNVAVISSEQFFQFPFCVQEIVSMGRYMHVDRFQSMSAKDHEIIQEAMQATDILHLHDRAISQLSSGERQRTFIARALAQKPGILMLDEPNAHLDINHVVSIFRLLHHLNKKMGMSVIVILHDLAAAAAFCKSVVLLDKGKLICAGPAETVITEKNIQETYGVNVKIHPSPEGDYPQIHYESLVQT